MGAKRRDFLKHSALLGLAGLSSKLFGGLDREALNKLETALPPENKFSLPELPYAPEALEPFIDKDTMLLHHGKHHKAYVDNLNKALLAENLNVELEELLGTVSKRNASIRNNAGGHYNHSLFWKLMKAPSGQEKNLPTGALSEALNKSFGGYENFVKSFGETALKVFGSGWCWLIVNAEKQFAIAGSPNQDNPLMDLASVKGTPVLALDVWEHAYYLKYQNRRVEYIQNWWNLVNWEMAGQLYTEAMGK